MSNPFEGKLGNIIENEIEREFNSLCPEAIEINKIEDELLEELKKSKEKGLYYQSAGELEKVKEYEKKIMLLSIKLNALNEKYLSKFSQYGLQCSRGFCRRTGQDMEMSKLPDGKYVWEIYKAPLEKIDYYDKDRLAEGLRHQEEYVERNKEKMDAARDKMERQIQEAEERERKNRMRKRIEEGWSEQLCKLEDYLEELKMACHIEKDFDAQNEIVQINLRTWKREWDKPVVKRQDEINKVCEAIKKERNEPKFEKFEDTQEDKRPFCSMCEDKATRVYLTKLIKREGGSYTGGERIYCCERHLPKKIDTTLDFKCVGGESKIDYKGAAYVNKDGGIACRDHKG